MLGTAARQDVLPPWYTVVIIASMKPAACLFKTDDGYGEGRKG